VLRDLTADDIRELGVTAIGHRRKLLAAIAAYELRAAVSLARLWGEQGRRAEAGELLASVYGWFTEGFDTADLKEARTLVAQLA
jgi:predicted ATPase